MKSFAWAVVALFGAAGCLHAQQPHLVITVDRKATTGLAVTNDGPRLTDPLPAGDPIVLEVRCTGNVDCTRVTVESEVDGTATENWSSVGAAGATRAVFSAPRATFSTQGLGNRLVVKHASDTPQRLFLGSRPPAAATLTPDSTLVALQEFVGDPTLPCDYDLLREARDSGVVAWEVTPVGRVLRRSAREIDESSQLVVFIRGPRSLVSRMWAERGSDFRTVGGFEVVGAESSFPPAVLREASRDAGDCRLARSVVENFKGGAEGTVNLRLAAAATGTVKDTFVTRTTGTVQLPVNGLYRGVLSLGLARTQLEDPAYSVAARDSVLVASEGGARFLYTLFFTPYVWGRRDVEHWRIADLPKYLNPTVGVVVNHVAGNALGGATLELPGGVFLTAGYHAGKVTRLVPGGPAVGSVVSGRAASLLTEERWQARPFYSISVDLRAAAILLNRLAGTAAGGG